MILDGVSGNITAHREHGRNVLLLEVLMEIGKEKRSRRREKLRGDVSRPIFSPTGLTYFVVVDRATLRRIWDARGARSRFEVEVADVEGGI